MKSNITKLLLFTTSCLLLATTSCTLVDFTQPPKGNMTLCTQWHKCTPGISIPSSHIVEIDNQTLTFKNTTNNLPNLDAGNYPIHIYNVCDLISINGTTATVSSSNNQVVPSPGWLFTSVSRVEYADFEDRSITVVMQQQVRLLTLTLEPQGEAMDMIESITATLSGVTSAWDFKNNKPVGDAMSVPLSFTQQEDGKWQANVKLLGIIGSTQKLCGTITFNDNAMPIVPLNSDLSSELTAFNINKEVPVSLVGMIKLPVEGGFSATITEWRLGGNSGGVAW